MWLVLRWFRAGVSLAQVWCLYGYALARFPSVAYFHPELKSTRTMPSRRHAVLA